MSRFTEYLKEAMGDEVTIGNDHGNVYTGKNTVLTHVPTEAANNEEDDTVQQLIDAAGIPLEKDVVQTIISLVDKTLNDWNRDKDINGNHIAGVVYHALKNGLIEVK